MSRALPAVVLLTAFVGCAEEGGSIAQGRSVDQLMIHGGDAPDAPEHDAVVAITTFSKPKQNFFCSGTLIGPDLVLTAAHCLDEAGFGAAYNEVEATDIKVGFGNGAKDIAGMTYLKVDDVVINTGYDRTVLGIDDVALIRLIDDAEALLGVTPVPALPLSLELDDPGDVGATMNFAGFGQNNTPDKDFTKLQVDVDIDDVDPSNFDYSKENGGTCFGDSGGPAFLDRSGTIYVAGITTWSTLNCSGFGSQGGSMRADQYETFIATVF